MEGGGVGHGPTLVGAKFLDLSFPYFKTYFMQIGHCYLETTILFKTFDPIILFVSMFLLCLHC